MAFLRLIWRRLLAQRLLALVLLVTMGFTVGVLVAGPIYAQGAGRAIVQGTVAQAWVNQRNVRIDAQAAPGFDQAAADAAVRRAVAGLPVERVVRQAQSGAVNVSRGAGEGFTSSLVFRDDGFDHLRMEGTAPSRPGEVAVAAADASPHGIHLGDTLTLRVGGAPPIAVRVTALYQVPLLSDEDWFGRSSPTARPEQFDEGPTPPAIPYPVLVSPEGFAAAAAALGVTTGPHYDWDLYLALDGTSLDHLRALNGRIERMAPQLRGTMTGTTFVAMLTGLPRIAQTAATRVGEARAPIFLVVFQIAAVAFAVLAGVATLALSRQSFELAVLKSRGFTPAQLLLAQAVESLLAALGAFPVGLGLGLLLAGMARGAHGPYLAGTVFPIGLSPTAVAVGAAAALGGALLVLAASVPHVLRGVLQERQQVSREARPILTRVPFELLAGLLGLVAFSEVRSRGLTPLGQGDTLDPLVLLAPTLLLFAASFGVLRLLLWAFRRLDGAVGRVRALPLYLAGRRLGRTPSASFATALLLLLATGLLVVSSSFRASVLTSHADVARQQVGADWAVETVPAGQSLALMRRLPERSTALYRGRFDALDPGDFVGPVDLASSTPDISLSAAGSTLAAASVLAIDPASYASGGWWRGDEDARPLDDLLGTLSNAEAGTALPDGARRLVLTATAAPDLAGFLLAASVERADGTVRSVSFGTIAAGPARYAGEVTGARRLLSVTVQKDGQYAAPPVIHLTLSSLRVEGAAEPANLAVSGWRPLRWQGSGGTARGAGDSLAATLRPGGGTVAAGLVPPEPEVPAVGSNDLTALAGRRVSATICGVGMTLRFDRFVSRFPGTQTGPFVLLPAGALFQRLERVPQGCGGITEVRSMAGTSPAPALVADGLTVLSARGAARMEAVLAQDPQTLALGMHFAGAAGGMGLVVIGLGVSLYFGQRRRQFEVAALRAMGTERRQLLAAVLGEQAFLLAFSIAAALAFGYGLLRLILPYAARELASASPPGGLVIDWPAIGLFGGAVVAAVALGLALGVRALLAASVPSVLRGEAE